MTDPKMDEPTGECGSPPDLPPLNFKVVAAAEAALILVALILGFLGIRHPDHSIFGWSSSVSFWSIWLWGFAGFAPMGLALLALDRMPGRFFEGLRRDTCEVIKPLFAHLSISQMALIAILAGVSEELLFRWALQDGMAYLVGGQWGWLIGWMGASLLFGAAHFINKTYVVMATIIGFWLGGVMLVADSWMAPAIAHALYDFVALCYLGNRIPGFRQVNRDLAAH